MTTASTTSLMTSPVDALRADHAAVLEAVSGLSPAAWESATGCPAWSVKDLVAHLAVLFRGVLDPSSLPDVTGLPTEQAQDVLVASRSGWSPDEVVADYVDAAAAIFPQLEQLASLHDLELPLGELGTYAAPVAIRAFNFDHATHLRADLLAPRGSIDRPVPPLDEQRAGPVADWILAALPQQSADVLARLSGPVALDLIGPGARSVVITPSDGILPADAHGRPSSVARVTCNVMDLCQWTTGRTTWNQLEVRADGNPEALATLCQVHVF